MIASRIADTLEALFKEEMLKLLPEKKEERTDAICCLGPNHKCLLNVNGGFCCAESCQYKVYEIRHNNQKP